MGDNQKIILTHYRSLSPATLRNKNKSHNTKSKGKKSTLISKPGGIQATEHVVSIPFNISINITFPRGIVRHYD